MTTVAVFFFMPTSKLYPMNDENTLTIRGHQQELESAAIKPAAPLWQRAPGRDERGRPLSDFMMVVRGLRQQPTVVRDEKIRKIRQLLEFYKTHVVFADLNLKINVLWVTVKPIPGVIMEIATAINLHIPEAMLVGENPDL